MIQNEPRIGIAARFGRNRSSIFAMAVVAACLAFAASEDISPNAPHGELHTQQTDTAGLTIKLAGDQTTLFAVSLNAGVWRSTGRAPWQQLPNSPRYAFTIASDPDDPAHLVVGERNGDKTVLAQNMAGAWESLDSGDTWTYVVDPINDFGCGSQVVPGVAFSGESTFFAGTACGLVNGSDLQLAPLPATGGGPLYNGGDRSVTAVSASAGTVWARTADTLLFSTDDGDTWTAAAIPAQCDAQNDCAIDVAGQSGAANVQVRCGPARGDLYSLAGFDNFAIMSCNSSLSVPGNCFVMVYDPSRATAWSLQQVVSGNGPAGDGTGLFGRRLVRSFELSRPDLPAAVGQRLQLAYGAAQNLYQATGRGANGVIAWKDFAVTDASGPPATPPADPLLKNLIHADTWDVNFAPDGRAAWISSDGGVYENTFGGMGWVTRNDGLHTHHAHTMNLLPAPPPRSPLLYATQDNDGWHSDAPGTWRRSLSLGDADFSIADPGNTTLGFFGRPSFSGNQIRTGQGVLAAFGAAKPAGAQFNENSRFATNHFQAFSPRSLQFIATLPGESPTYPLLDAVMLINPPLQFFDSNNMIQSVPGVLGQAGGPLLIRNTQFAANPDIDLLYRDQYANGQDWQLEAGGLPAGALGFVVSGGHANPVYYVYAPDMGDIALFKREGGAWNRLAVDGLLVGSTHGPVFVNPWDPDQVFVLTDSGIRVSADGGDTFTDDTVLTALLTGSGAFPLTASFFGGNSNGVFLASQAKAMATLSHMFFDRARVGAVLATSPFTGVFFSPGDGTWDDLTPNLPRPFTPVSGVGIDSVAVYVALEGRSVVRFTGADVRITKTDAPDPVAPGQALVYDITVANDGPNDAFAVTVTDVLPAGVTFDSDTDACVEAPAGTLTCALGDLAPGGTRTFQVQVTVDPNFVRQTCEPTFLTNTASVRAGTVDPDLSNNEAATDTEVDFSLKHFLCYEAERRPLAPVERAQVDDLFGPGTVDVGLLKRLCTPTDKNGEDPVAPLDPCHLTGYEIDQHPPAFRPVKNQVVVNQFGTETIEVRRPELLLLPTAKDHLAPPAPLVDPPIDHFKCHRVVRARERRSGLSIIDQLGSLLADIKSPFRLCSPASKNGGTVHDPDTHLMCYRIRTDPPRPGFRGPFFVSNQFEDRELHVTRTTELCVPSVLNPE